MSLPKTAVHEFIRKRGFGVLSTVSPSGAPEAALVNLAVTPELELIFHALRTTRKCANLEGETRVAVVIGWDGEETLQYEGVAAEVEEHELDEVKKFYFEACPDATGQSGWPGLIYFRIRPTWIRFSRYSLPWQIEEMNFPPRDKIDAKRSRRR